MVTTMPLSGTRPPFDAGRPPGLVAVALLVAGFVAAFVVVADMRVHKRVQDDRGVNIWGYRGPIARFKKVEDRRIVFLGGTLAFGPGLPRAETVPAYLERNIHQGWRTGNSRLQSVVVNLAAPGDGPLAYVATLTDYASLDPDIVCILSDGDAADADSPTPWRRHSAIYRATGYFPLLPAVATGGFAAASVSAPRASDITPAGAASSDCGGAFKPHCDGLKAAIEHVLAKGRRVLVVGGPAMSEPGRARRAAVAAMLGISYGGRADVRSVDIGDDLDLARLIPSKDAPLTAAITDRVAELITTPLLELMR